MYMGVYFITIIINVYSHNNINMQDTEVTF